MKYSDTRQFKVYRFAICIMMNEENGLYFLLLKHLFYRNRKLHTSRKLLQCMAWGSLQYMVSVANSGDGTWCSCVQCTMSTLSLVPWLPQSVGLQELTSTNQIPWNHCLFDFELLLVFMHSETFTVASFLMALAVSYIAIAGRDPLCLKLRLTVLVCQTTWRKRATSLKPDEDKILRNSYWFGSDFSFAF